MSAALLAGRLPGAAWARQAGTHLRWRRRESRADAADRSGRPFRYVHPIVGPFAYHPGDYLSRRVFLHNDFECNELRLAIDRARAGGTIVDVGANIGVFTIACAHAAGSRGRVIALEPGRATFEKLSQSCAMAGVTNVTLLRAAAGCARGTAWLRLPPSGRDVHQYVDTGIADQPGNCAAIEVVTLDEACGPATDEVTLLKIDVEGHELAVLEGASRILERRAAALIVEFNPPRLAAAAASVAALWALLSRTHNCAAVFREDGSPQPAIESSVMSGALVNTFWEPLTAR